MGRWKASLIISGIAIISKSINPNKISSIYHPIKPPYISPVSISRFNFICLRSFSAVPCPSTINGDEYDNNFDQNYVVDPKDDEESETIPVRAIFLCTRRHIPTMHALKKHQKIPKTHSICKFLPVFSSDSKGTGAEENVSCCRYMVVYQYGSAVLFNMEDHEVDSYLEIVRRHASGSSRE